MTYYKRWPQHGDMVLGVIPMRFACWLGWLRPNTDSLPRTPKRAAAGGNDGE